MCKKFVWGVKEFGHNQEPTGTNLSHLANTLYEIKMTSNIIF